MSSGIAKKSLCVLRSVAAEGFRAVRASNGIRHLIPLEMVNEEGGKQKAERKLNTLPLILSLFEAERKSNERFRCADYRFQRVVV